MYLSDVTSFKIDFSKEEVTDTAYDIRTSLLQVAETHWFFHFKNDHKQEDILKVENFISFIKDKEKYRFKRLEFLFGLIGYQHVYFNLDEDLKTVFKRKTSK